MYNSDFNALEKLGIGKPDGSTIIYAYVPKYDDSIFSLETYYPIPEENELRTKWLASTNLSTYRSAIELGCGGESSIRTKSMPTLKACKSASEYVAIDISEAFCESVVRICHNEAPQISCVAFHQDFKTFFPINCSTPSLIFQWGLTLGNFLDEDVITVLQNIKANMHPGDRLVLSADSTTNKQKLYGAYGGAKSEPLTKSIIHHFSKYSYTAISDDDMMFGHTFDPVRSCVVNGITPKVDMHFANENSRVTLHKDQFYELIYSHKRSPEKLSQLAEAAGLKLDRVTTLENSGMYVAELTL